MKFLYSTLAICLCMTSLTFAQNTPDKGHLSRDSFGLWGMVTEKSEWLIVPFYDTLFYLSKTNFDPETYEVTYSKTEYVLGKSDGKWRLFNNRGKLLYEAQAILPRLMGDIILVKKKDKWGLVNTKGKVALPVQCTAIDWHEDVLVLKDKKGKWRLFDPQNGRLEEQWALDKVSLLSAPNKKVLLLLEKEGKKGIVDQYFRTIVPLQYEELMWAKEKEGWVYFQKEQDQCGYIHLKTKKMETTACQE